VPSRHTVVATTVDTYRVVTPGSSITARQVPRKSLRFRLHSQDLTAGVDVRLDSFRDRWVATVCDGRRTEIGLGSLARSALTAAVHALAPSSAVALLADPELFAVSCRILATS
jgi:hypothetical protein